jgi:hypothetical protein
MPACGIHYPENVYASKGIDHDCDNDNDSDSDGGPDPGPDTELS